jgi:aryl-alcohol dehydrogenase-like predicted oxidoreductase
MHLRRLGRTDLHVSSICLGTMTFGQQNTEAEAHALLDRAIDRGVNFLDAAELYPIPPKPETQGRTEEILGSWLATRGNRDRVVVATKVVGRTAMSWFRNDGSPPRVVRRQVEEAIERSLRRLRTDVIDLYQLHWPEREVGVFGSNPTRWGPVARAPDEAPIAEQLAIFEEIRKAGKIRHFGLSNESAWGTMRWVAAAEAGIGPRPVSIQNAYNLLNRTFEVNLAEVADRESVGLLAYSPLAQGYLTGKYQGGALPKGSRKQLFDRLQRYEKPGAAEAVDSYVAIARNFRIDPASFALAFTLSKRFVTASIVGATNLEQLDTALSAADVEWTADMDAAVDAVHQRVGNPCP